MDNLKPCPNPDCNGTDLIVNTDYRMNYFVHCRDLGCEMVGPNNLTRDGAITAWNNLPRREDSAKLAEALREYADDDNWGTSATVPMLTGKSMFEDDEEDVEFDMGETRIWRGENEGPEAARAALANWNARTEADHV